jgi:hypothetical protein
VLAAFRTSHASRLAGARFLDRLPSQASPSDHLSVATAEEHVLLAALALLEQSHQRIPIFDSHCRCLDRLIII